MINALDDMKERRKGFDSFPDAYMTKPFYLEELNKKINELLD